MSISTISKKNVPYGRTSADDEFCVMQYICDTAADVASLPVTSVPGSTATVISTGDIYTLNGSGAWVRTGSSPALADTCGYLPHTLSVTGSVTVQVISVGGWDLYEPKTIKNGAWVYNGWKLKISCFETGAFVNGVRLPMSGEPDSVQVGYYTVGTGADVAIFV